MNYLRLFGSPKKNIIIGLVMFLSVIPLNFLVNVFLFQYDDALEAFSLLIRLVSWAGLITVGVGIAMLGGEKGWWGDLDKQFTQGGLGEEGCADKSEGKGRKVNENCSNGTWHTGVRRDLLRFSRRGGIGRHIQRDYR